MDIHTIIWLNTLVLIIATLIESTLLYGIVRELREMRK
jgi:hypothetical protein